MLKTNGQSLTTSQNASPDLATSKKCAKVLFGKLPWHKFSCQGHREKNRINLLFSTQIGFCSIDLLKIILTLIVLCFQGASGQVENILKGQVQLRYKRFTRINIACLQDMAEIFTYRLTFL